MSSREPLWYCHECHAEMRPLLVPDPACASCRGTFVEKMDNIADDPREFTHPPPTGPEGDGLPPGIDTFLLGLQSLMDRRPGDRPRSTGPSGPSPGVAFQIRTGSGQRGPGSVPTMTQ
jgi:E3 ubiquitin-protein ligase RNF115/126